MGTVESVVSVESVGNVETLNLTTKGKIPFSLFYLVNLDMEHGIDYFHSSLACVVFPGGYTICVPPFLMLPRKFYSSLEVLK